MRRDRASTSKIEHTPLWAAWVSLPIQGRDIDLGRLDTAYLLQLTSRNIELEATISAMADIASVKPEYWADRPTRPSEGKFQELNGNL